jgi:hypothetical protein
LSLLSVISVQAGGQILWNGDVITEPVLRRRLKETATFNPVPVTQLKFDANVDCETVLRLRQIMNEMLDCSYGKCAEGSGKWWFLGDVVGPGVSREPFEMDVSRNTHELSEK